MRIQHRIILKVADITFAVSSDQAVESIRFEDAYRDFFCTDDPEIDIQAFYDGIPQISLQDKDRVFDSEMVWKLYWINKQYVFVLNSPVFGSSPYRIAIFDSNFRRGEIFSLSPDSGTMAEDSLFNPLEFPLSEMLMICLLAQKRGLMIHACGIDDGGLGYLFAGNSTHGKTTMSQVWKERATILNDDRIVLRQHEGRFWMYGTPWHGDYSGISPHGVPLEKIFFLQHAEVNRVSRKEGVIAASMVLTRCFPPLWDPEGMRFTLDFCAQLVETIPCYELDFVPNESVVDFVRCVK